MRPLSKDEKRLFAAVTLATITGQLALVAGTCAKTGEDRAILCISVIQPNGDVTMAPVGSLSVTAFDEFTPPDVGISDVGTFVREGADLITVEEKA